MPKLVALGRRWRASSDDTGFPAAFHTVLSASWLTCLSYVAYRQPRFVASSSRHYRLFSMFVGGGMSLAVTSIAVDLATIAYSQRGTLINASPRKRVGTLIAAKLGLDSLGLVVNALGTKLAWYSGVPVSEPGLRMLRNAVKVGWGIFVSSILLFALVFIPERANREPIQHNLESTETLGSITAKNFRKRLSTVCRFLGVDNYTAINSVAEIVQRLFYKDVDVAPSDIVTAMALLEDEQCERKKALTESLSTISPIHHAKWMSEEQAHHYCKYACGAYGWPMYLFCSPFASFALLKVLSKGRFVPRSLPDNIRGDNSLLANTTVIKMTTGLEDEDLVYVSFENKLFQIPFYVALDHEDKAIVVAIRGTLSLDDVFTDLTAFASDGVPVTDIPNAMAHEGMLLTAKHIQRMLTGYHGHRYVLGADETPLLTKAREQLTSSLGEEEAAKYKVVVCGHSLGGGTAAILAMLLNDHKDVNKDFQCFAYSPPGGLMSATAARYCKDFVCSVVFDDDIVCRLGVVGGLKLKLKMFEIIKNCDRPKLELVGTWLEKLLGFKSSLKVEQPVPCSWLGDPEAQAMVEKFQADMDEAIADTEHDISQYTRMHLPGVVMYISDKEYSQCKSKHGVYWTDGHYPLFSEVILSSGMITHHMPWKVLNALDAIQTCKKQAQENMDKVS